MGMSVLPQIDKILLPVDFQNPCTGVVRPADNKRKYRLDEDGYKILGDCLREAEENGEPWRWCIRLRRVVP